MDQETRDNVIEWARDIANPMSPYGYPGERTIAATLLFERSEVERLTAALAAAKAPAPSLTADARQHALDTARHVMGHERATSREDVLAAGLLGERAEGDRLGSLLDTVRAFAALRVGDDASRVLAEVRSFIATHRVQR